jgi:pSer/pThr/pTyr-binding forkhead associated (FHA) protein
MLKLRFIDRSQDPTWVVDKSFAMGSAEDNHFIIDDPSVSPQHARIVLANQIYTLCDLSSQNGTFVNGQRIHQKNLVDGDKIKLGNVLLEVIDPSLPGRVSEWTMVACSSWLSGQEFPIKPKGSGNQVKVGRASHCDLIFPGTHLSREHAKLTLGNQAIQVEDLDSSNGTFINDTRITQGTAYSGDILRLDVYSFMIFGPGNQKVKTPLVENDDIHSTKLRAPISLDSVSPSLDPVLPQTLDDKPKRWKTRPTSPGNRQNMDDSQQPIGNMAKLSAALLSVAVIGLILYVIFG